MKDSTRKVELVGICHKIELLRPSTYNSNDIRVDIGSLKDGKDTPCNFSIDYETPKSSNGGLFARIFASEYGEGANANIFSDYGPEITYGDLRAYQHAARALERVSKRQRDFYAARGNAVDAAEAMGRWLEACGVAKVYVRPDSEQRETWMNRGEWTILFIGDFVNKVRAKLHIAPVKIAEPIAAQA